VVFKVAVWQKVAQNSEVRSDVSGGHSTMRKFPKQNR
jgi:hypothetical protein